MEARGIYLSSFFVTFIFSVPRTRFIPASVPVYYHLFASPNTVTPPGLSPTSTPILTKLTVRQSLFEDFEEMEKQCMAGEVDGDEQEEIVSPEISG